MGPDRKRVANRIENFCGRKGDVSETGGPAHHKGVATVISCSFTLLLMIALHHCISKMCSLHSSANGWTTFFAGIMCVWVTHAAIFDLHWRHIVDHQKIQ